MKKLILLGLVWSTFLVATAQDNKHLSFDNLYLFIQLGVVKDYQTYAQGGAFLQYEHHYFRISAVAAEDKAGEQKYRHTHQGNCNCTTKVRGINTVNFEYGRIYKFFRRQQFSFSSGVSIVTKTDPDELFNQNKEYWEPERYNERVAVGLPYELRYSFMVTRGIGLGCSYYGNLNAKKNFNALSFGLALGLF